MRTPSRPLLRSTVSILIVTLSVAGAILYAESNQHKSLNNGSRAGNSQIYHKPTQYIIVVPDFTETSAIKSSLYVDQVRKQRASIANDLIEQLQRSSTSTVAKVQIINLLGEIRAEAAVNVLIEYINFRDILPPATYYLHFQQGGGYPARNALTAIGTPAVDRILTRIGSKNFNANEIDGYIEVLWGVETPQCALIRLDDRLARTEDKGAKLQYQQVIDKIKYDIAHTN